MFRQVPLAVRARQCTPNPSIEGIQNARDFPLLLIPIVRRSIAVVTLGTHYVSIRK